MTALPRGDDPPSPPAPPGGGRVELSALTSPEVADLAAAGALLAVPVGSTEQHGPHLALGTDAGDVRPIADLLPLLRVSSVRAVSPSGVLGDPAGASAAEGEAVLTALLADLQGRIENWWPNRGDPT